MGDAVKKTISLPPDLAEDADRDAKPESGVEYDHDQDAAATVGKQEQRFDLPLGAGAQNARERSMDHGADPLIPFVLKADPKSAGGS